MSTMNESQIKASLTAARNLALARDARGASGATNRSGRSPNLLANQRAAMQLLASCASKVGCNTDDFGKIIAQNQTEMRRLLEEQKAAAIVNSSSVQQSLRQGIDNRVKALGLLPSAPPSPFYLTLNAPFMIWPTQGLFLDNQNIEPWNSWVKFKFDSGQQVGSQTVTFYYLWENPSDKYAVVNIDGFIVLNGYCQVGQNGGTFPGDRFASISLDAQLNPLEWWNQPPTSPLAQTDQSQLALTVATVDSAGFFDVGEIESSKIYRGYDLSYDSFLLPPSGVTVIEVALSISYANGSDGGHVWADFESGDFQVMSPFVSIAILT